MLNRNLALTGLVMLVLVCSAVDCLALQVTLKPCEVATISSPTDTTELRLLVKYDLAGLFSTARILYAQLNGTIEVSSSPDGGMVNVEAPAITTQWDAGTVTWTAPWTDVGGDVDPNIKGTFLVREGVQPLRIDITDVVTEWLEGERPNAGVMLRVSPSFGGTFRIPTTVNDGVESLQAPVVRVWYLPEVE